MVDEIALNSDRPQVKVSCSQPRSDLKVSSYPSSVFILANVLFTREVYIKNFGSSLFISPLDVSRVEASWSLIYELSLPFFPLFRVSGWR